VSTSEEGDSVATLKMWSLGFVLIFGPLVAIGIIAELWQRYEWFKFLAAVLLIFGFFPLGCGMWICEFGVCK
jgi:hypothetical protein